MRSSGVWLIAAVLVSACAMGARPPPAPPRRSNLGLTLSTFRLANGLEVVLVKDPSATEIQVTMQYRVGAADDPVEQPGMAHLVEHLMYQQVLGAQTLFAQLEAAASEFTGYTTFDATTYTAQADRTHLEKLLAIEAVRAGFRCSTITESVFVREREVVANEVRQRDPAHEVLVALHQGIYPAQHPYRRALGGSVESVSSISFQQACAFADAHYAPNNAVLVVSGNINADEVQAALAKFLGRVAKRPVVARAAVPPPVAGGHRADVNAPIDDDALLFAWPLPVEPLERVRVRAIASAIAVVINAEVNGRVVAAELGDSRAPVLGVIVVPASGEKLADVIAAAKRGVDSLPSAFTSDRYTSLDEIVFDNLQQSAIHGLYASLDEDAARDARLASYVLAGRDPIEALAGEFAGLREMSQKKAAAIARDQLSFKRAAIVSLLANDGKKHGRSVTLPTTVHDFGQRRSTPDPSEAHRPATTAVASDPPGMKTRTLPNGLEVVLLPLSNVPTVDIRLVFRSGTADEWSDKRGAALVAANALQWDLRYLNDLLRFVAAGGTKDVTVNPDHTTFAARGVDMHLDLLLAGLRRWVREGTYEDAEAIVDTMRDQAKRLDDEGALTDAWRGAVFGTTHPYARAGLVRHASAQLTVQDAEAFRTAHYTPDNATLVIAGHFDAALADRWIDFLFADWTGRAEELPRTPAPPPPPASLAKVDDLVQLYLRIVLPASAESRAHRLVVAAMLDEVVADVRHQLGASYGVDAQLAEMRRSTHYTIEGWIDSGRAADAVKLLRERIEKLVGDPDEAARVFVSARTRVLTQLRSVHGSAARLANRVERDVGLEQTPLADLQTARAIRALTIDNMTRAFAELDLARATVLMRGPAAELKLAFGALDRTPTYVKFDQAAQDALDDDPTAAAPQPSRRRQRERLTLEDLEPAITEESPPLSSRFAFRLTPGYVMANTVTTSSRIKPDCCTGYSISGSVGYRFDNKLTMGLQLDIATLKGSYRVDVAMEQWPLELVPVDVAVFAEGIAYGRIWGGVTAGLHFGRITEPDPEGTTDPLVWHRGLSIGLRGGVDLVRFGRHRLGVFGTVRGTLATPTGYSALTLGLGYGFL